jgi:predicted ferric reductase
MWLVSNAAVLSTAKLGALRGPGIQLTGLLAIASACAGAMLSLRLRLPEKFFGGLDKLYRSHRALGIAALMFALAHWTLIQAPGWFGSGDAAGAHREHRVAPVVSGLQQVLQSQRGLATSLGNWGFYALIVLVLIALVSRIPYRAFYLTHRLIPAVLLLLVFHSLVLFNYAQWMTPIGIALGLFLVGGVVSALSSLAGRIGAGRRATGVVTGLKYYPELRVLQSELEMSKDWPGHAAGQFAFVHGGRWEGQHPFTIASAWNPADRKVSFVTKELGDFTSTLSERAQLGAVAHVEGPYGAFTFEDDCPMQIWIAGGVGITPFIARLRQRHNEPGVDRHQVHLFYTSESDHEEGIGQLAELAEAAAVSFTFLHTPRHGFLTGERVRAEVPEWRRASIWFCGPAAFGEAIRSDFTGQGMKRDRFHQEMFGWR